MQKRSSLPIYIDDDLIRDRQIYDITDQVNIPHKLTKTIVDKSLISKNESKIRSQINMSRLVSNSVKKLKELETPNLLNSKIIKRNVFLSIDSRYRDRSYRISNGIRFNLGINQQSSSNSVLGLVYPLDQITEIELMNSVILPITKRVDYTYIYNTYYDEVTIGIDEIRFQSYLGSFNNYHFCCKTQSIPYGTDSNRQLAMISYDLIFKLQQPYNLDKTITLTFSSPNNNITFNDDNYLVYVEYTNPAIITIYSNNIDPILPLNFLSANDTICFENFKSSNDKYDSNNPSSPVYYEKFYPITPIIDQFTFTIPLDLTDPILVNDPNKPPSDPVYNIPYLVFLFFSINTNSISLYYEGPQIANIDDILYFYKLITGLAPPFVNTDSLLKLYSKNGFKITDINAYGLGFIYDINFNDIYYSLVYQTQSTPYPTAFSIYTTINTRYDTSTTTGVSIYVGSRRVRVPLRFETLVSEN